MFDVLYAMNSCSCLFLAFLAYVQAGPYIWRGRPVALPLVDAAQSLVHDQYLLAEKEALQTSLDISRLADATNKEVYSLTYEAQSRLMALVSDLNREAADVKRFSQHCVDEENFQQTIIYLSTLTEKLYNCTHALSNTGVTFEVQITERLIAARDQVWYVKQAMWFCQKYQPEVDTMCLQRLVDEGMLMLSHLPQKARVVLFRAQAARAQLLEKLDSCFFRHQSAAEQRHLMEVEKMKRCVQGGVSDSEEQWDW